MGKSQAVLAGRLLYLPLDIHEKVLLWLAYKGLKSVSEITVERRGNVFALAKRGIRKESTYKYNSPSSKRIRKWIRDAGLSIAIEPKFNTSWHIGKDRDKVSLSVKIIHKLDYDNEVKTGLLLGFPKESVKGYAKDRVAKSEKEMIPMIWPGDKCNDPYLKNKYYTPYVFYAIRKDCVVEDSKIAQIWADTIRKEVPLLAKWFEKQEIARM